MVVALRTNQAINSQLGDQGLADVAANLWTGMCVTCGKPLEKSDPPALLVHHVADVATASLHHSRCRQPDWHTFPEQSRLAVLGQVTQVCHAFLIPMGLGADAEMYPMVLINPQLEQLKLTRRAGQGWAVSTAQDWGEALGLGVPGPGLNLDVPVPGCRGTLTSESVMVRAGAHVWRVSAEPEVADRVRELGGALLAVTTRMNPYDAAGEDYPLAEAFSSGQLMLGWLAVDIGSGPSGEQLERMVWPAPGPRARGDEVRMVGYPGPSYDHATGRFKIGEDACGQELWWRLHTPGHGMEHGLITGRRGTDISGILRVVLVEAALARRFQLMVADPLNGNQHCDLFAQRARITAHNFGATVDLLTDALREIVSRENSGNDYTNPTPERPGILIGIDDADAVLGNKRAARLAAQIVERGRPAGIGLVIASHTVDPADYASNTSLLLGLAATNTYLLSPEHAEFLQNLRPTANTLGERH